MVEGKRINGIELDVRVVGTTRTGRERGVDVPDCPGDVYGEPTRDRDGDAYGEPPRERDGDAYGDDRRDAERVERADAGRTKLISLADSARRSQLCSCSRSATALWLEMIEEMSGDFGRRTCLTGDATRYASSECYQVIDRHVSKCKSLAN